METAPSREVSGLSASFPPTETISFSPGLFLSSLVTVLSYPFTELTFLYNHTRGNTPARAPLASGTARPHEGRPPEPSEACGSYVFEASIKDLKLALGEVGLGLELLQSLGPMANHGHLQLVFDLIWNQRR